MSLICLSLEGEAVKKWVSRKNACCLICGSVFMKHPSVQSKACEDDDPQSLFLSFQILGPIFSGFKPILQFLRVFSQFTNF